MGVIKALEQGGRSLVSVPDEPGSPAHQESLAGS